MLHALAAQVAVACGRTHARPHAPQLLNVLVVFVSQPLLASPSQSPNPVAQRTTVHAPPAQPALVVLASAQRWPHIPQFAGSMAVFAQYATDPAMHVVTVDAHVVAHAPLAQT